MELGTEHSLLVGMGGLGSDSLPRPMEVLEIGGDSDNESNIDQLQHVPRGSGAVGYPPSIASFNLHGDGQEEKRRNRLAESDAGDNDSDGESATYTASQSGGAPSIFSDDKRVPASITSGPSVAWHGPNLAELAEQDEGHQVPPIMALENSASPNITNPGGWYNNSTSGGGSGSTSAAAMALSAAMAQAAADPTAIVAHLPCEFARHGAGCKATFPLHASGAGVDHWIMHIDVMHLHGYFPRKAGCWFCDRPFQIHRGDYKKDVAESVFKKRMQHISRHYQRKPDLAPEDIHPDLEFETHLKARGLIKGEERSTAPAGLDGGQHHTHDTEDSDNDVDENSHEGGTKIEQTKTTREGGVAANVPSAQDVRAPMTISTVPTRRPRRDDVQIITERRRGPRRGGPSSSFRQQVMRE